MKKIASLGAHVQDPANLETVDELFQSTAETTVLNFDFKVDLATYLSDLGNTTLTSLRDVIEYNDKNAAIEMPAGECCQGESIALNDDLEGLLVDHHMLCRNFPRFAPNDWIQSPRVQASSSQRYATRSGWLESSL